MTLSELLDADWRRLLEFSGEIPRPRRLADGISPRFASVFLIRLAHSLHRSGWRRLARIASLLNFVVFGIEVPSGLADGSRGSLFLTPKAPIIGAGYIGRNVTIYQQVTLGAKLADFTNNASLRPHVEDGVLITAGAKVLGPVRLGAGCVVGGERRRAREVCRRVQVAVGVPARIVQRAAAPAGSTS